MKLKTTFLVYKNHKYTTVQTDQIAFFMFRTMRCIWCVSINGSLFESITGFHLSIRFAGTVL